jgi:Cytochrome c7 and related cytochrome c
MWIRNALKRTLKQVRLWFILIVLATLKGQALKEPCAGCHLPQVSDLDKGGGSHAGLPCRSCHRETENHTLSSKIARETLDVEVCGRCHTKDLKLFVASPHGGAKEDGPTCTICHGTHRFKTARQIEQRCLHCHRAPPLFFTNPVPEVAGKVSCMNCHSAHSD